MTILAGPPTLVRRDDDDRICARNAYRVRVRIVDRVTGQPLAAATTITVAITRDEAGATAVPGATATLTRDAAAPEWWDATIPAASLAALPSPGLAVWRQLLIPGDPRADRLTVVRALPAD